MEQAFHAGAAYNREWLGILRAGFSNPIYENLGSQKAFF